MDQIPTTSDATANVTQAQDSRRSIIWVYPDYLTDRLDSATWIETSRWLEKTGWQVTLLSRGETDGLQNIRGVETICIASPSIYMMGQTLFHLAVAKHILANWSKTDVVLFSQLSGFWILPLRLLGAINPFRRPRFIMDTRDLDDLVPGNRRVYVRHCFHRLVFFLAGFLADGQTAITPRMAQKVNIPPRSLLGTWPSGVDPDVFAVSAAKRKWPEPGSPIHLMYIGILAEKRNLAPLCGAVKRANAAGMRFELSLVGDGPARATLEPYVDDAVQIVRPVPHEEVPDLLATAHIGVTSLPDPDDEKYQASSPIKLFEYMAAGLPVLATRNACHTEVVLAGDYVFWAADATEQSLLAALSQAWAARADLRSLGADARNAVQDWTWEAAALKLGTALEQGLA